MYQHTCTHLCSQSNLLDLPRGKISCDVGLAPPAPKEGALQGAWQAPPTRIDLPRDSKVADLRTRISLLCGGTFTPGSVFLDKRSSHSSRNVAPTPLPVDKPLEALEVHGKPLQLMVQANLPQNSRILRRAAGLLDGAAGPSGTQHGRHASRLPPPDGPARLATAAAAAAAAAPPGTTAGAQARQSPQARAARKPTPRSESPSVSKGQEQQQQQKQKQQQGRGKKRAPTPPSELEGGGSDDMKDDERHQQEEDEGAAEPGGGNEGGKQPQRRQQQKPRKRRKRVVPPCLRAPSSAAKRKSTLDGTPSSGGPKTKKSTLELSQKQGREDGQEASASGSAGGEEEGQAEQGEEEQHKPRRGDSRVRSTREEKKEEEEEEEEEKEDGSRDGHKGAGSCDDVELSSEELGGTAEIRGRALFGNLSVQAAAGTPDGSGSHSGRAGRQEDRPTHASQRRQQQQQQPSQKRKPQRRRRRVIPPELHRRR
ncbi:hypothetical protein DUNSADRAFT_4630 [Dunaliella salina]|uniref:Encoded protein n=1 Tax=Dunaliella salina TaxID=3046 RepID=A0ABQ7GRK0_DUNSA|nr:hypothetical protein DUNSADRAFT_4630 [Dunaliella salina]|eukprot:KAF5837239.1 hypothetical protein DUNSADRAFT_4630 [Dunaliella salina]